jgi:multisubunit Na+/H+ antiporter MnhC subunit
MIIAVALANLVFVVSQYIVYTTATRWGLIPILMVVVSIVVFAACVHLVILHRGRRTWVYVNEIELTRFMTAGWFLISGYVGWVGHWWYDTVYDLATTPAVLALIIGLALTSVGAWLLVETARTYHSRAPTIV